MSKRTTPLLPLFVLILLTDLSAVRALPEDTSRRFEITAERLELDRHAEVITYIDNVTVRRGTMLITADHMRMDYEDTKLVRITAHGNPARYQELLEADKGLMKANARKIVYHTREERVDLEGEAQVRQNGNKISAEFIHYDVPAGTIRAEAGRDGRVTVTIPPW